MKKTNSTKKTPSFKRPTWAKGHEWSNWTTTPACAYVECPAANTVVQVEKGPGGQFLFCVLGDDKTCASVPMRSAEAARKLAEHYLGAWSD